MRLGTSKGTGEALEEAVGCMNGVVMSSLTVSVGKPPSNFPERVFFFATTVLQGLVSASESR